MRRTMSAKLSTYVLELFDLRSFTPVDSSSGGSTFRPHETVFRA